MSFLTEIINHYQSANFPLHEGIIAEVDAIDRDGQERAVRVRCAPVSRASDAVYTSRAPRAAPPLDRPSRRDWTGCPYAREEK
jgi:hypothetical protein